MSTPTRDDLTIVGSYESNSGRWYVSKDRAWKVRLNDDNDATVIYKSHDIYRLILDTTYNVRERRAVSPGGPIHQDVVALVDQVRQI